MFAATSAVPTSLPPGAICNSGNRTFIRSRTACPVATPYFLGLRYGVWVGFSSSSSTASATRTGTSAACFSATTWSFAGFPLAASIRRCTQTAPSVPGPSCWMSSSGVMRGLLLRVMVRELRPVRRAAHRHLNARMVDHVARDVADVLLPRALGAVGVPPDLLDDALEIRPPTPPLTRGAVVDLRERPRVEREVRAGRVRLHGKQQTPAGMHPERDVVIFRPDDPAFRERMPRHLQPRIDRVEFVAKGGGAEPHAEALRAEIVEAARRIGRRGRRRRRPGHGDRADVALRRPRAAGDRPIGPILGKVERIIEARHLVTPEGVGMQLFV